MVRMCSRGAGVVLLAAVLAVGVGITALVPAGAAVRTAVRTSVRTANVLGTKNPAKGTPAKIGFITDDLAGTTDNSIETPVVNAATQWINQYRNGVGGHPIQIDRCVTNGEPGKSLDCANQMISDKVAAVIMGSNRNFHNSWDPLHTAGIPVFSFAAGYPAALADPASTFVFGTGTGALNALNIGAAQNMKPKSKKVSAVVIDVPAATDPYKSTLPAIFKEAGIDLQLTAIPAGTADMTPQMQKVASDNPKGPVFVLGNDTFCIAAFNGLRTAGYKGVVTAIPQCFSDATRTAVPADFLDGIQIAATAPIDNPKDPSMKQYYAVLDKFGASSVDKSRITGVSMFQGITGLNIATQNLKGDATPQSVIAAAKSMPWTELPATGGLHAQCGATIQPANPAVCMPGSLAATLGSDGKAKSYTSVGDVKPQG
jgi:branched-chain amino acid transport system substrate-binding protein